MQFDQHCLADNISVETLPSDCVPCQVTRNKVVCYSETLHIPSSLLSADFSHYIESLPTWQYQILQKVALHNDAFTTIKILNEDEEIFATSDRSAPNFIGSFGWAMETCNGREILHQCIKVC